MTKENKWHNAGLAIQSKLCTKVRADGASFDKILVITSIIFMFGTKSNESKRNFTGCLKIIGLPHKF